MGTDFSACRLVFGEADFFPGFTVDRFEDVLVTEVLSFGIDRRRDMLYPLLVKVLAEYGVRVRAIFERNEDSIRDKEGLPKYKGLSYDGCLKTFDGHVEICENGIFYDVIYINGHRRDSF